METVLKLEHITKRFGDFTANDDICLEVERGQIHSLLGENGAGKTTLMNVLYGLYTPNGGKIILEGNEIIPQSPQQMLDAGIAMVHQHFMLVPTMTVAENVILGQMKPFVPSLSKVSDEIRKLSEKLGFDIDPNALVSELTVGTQQRVEIIKALYRKVKILILDEPTAVLTPSETIELMDMLKGLAAEGMSILFISHKFNEVEYLSDVISVIRRGKIVGSLKRGEFSRSELAQMMTGRNVEFSLEKPEVTFEDNEPGLEVRNLFVKALNEKQSPKDISFLVKRGEILAITGVDGNGQKELLEALAGARKPSSGSVKMLGLDTTNFSAKGVLENSVGYIPSDRMVEGLLLEMTIEENLILEQYDKVPVSRHHMLQRKVISEMGKNALDTYDIRARNSKQPVSNLSGGNQQKVVVARALRKDPKVLLAAYPTRGLDIGAIESIHRLILEQRAKGCSVILFSNELDEVFALGDQVGVMFEGKMMGIYPSSALDKEKIGLMMAGTALEN